MQIPSWAMKDSLQKFIIVGGHSNMILLAMNNFLGIFHKVTVFRIL